MRLPRITFAIGAFFCLPTFLFSQFGLEDSAKEQADFFVEKAILHHDASEFTQAVSAYQKALNFFPGQPGVWYNLALVQVHIGDFISAERSLDTLFSFDPMDGPAHALHGLALYEQGECERAIAAYNFAISNEPTKHLYLARGLAYHCSGQFHLASLDFDYVLSVDPASLRACQAKAALLAERGNLHLAIRFCNRILGQEPGNVAALTTRGVCRFRQGAKFRAMADFDLALSHRQLAVTYLARAACRLEDGDFYGALTDAKFALRVDPFEPEVYSLLASLEMAEKNLAAATESLKIALEMSPERASYHFQNAMLSLKKADYSAAVEATYSAMDFGMDDDEGKAFLRSIYRRMDEERISIK